MSSSRFFWAGDISVVLALEVNVDCRGVDWDGIEVWVVEAGVA
jgi:hypothetical protein